jgi:hypothetical protein
MSLKPSTSCVARRSQAMLQKVKGFDVSLAFEIRTDVCGERPNTNRT